MNDKPSSPLSTVLFILAVGGILAAITIPHIIEKYFSTDVMQELSTIEESIHRYQIDWAICPPAVDRNGKPVILSGTAERSSMGYLPWLLTSPVGYLEKFSFDPYGPSKPKDWSGTYAYATYGYEFWIVISRGPDGDFDMKVEDFVFSASGDINLFLSHYGKGTAIEYDPSNGIISNGDIFRTGRY